MRVLHIFDHSIPLHSGYAFRSLSILKEQNKLGIETWHLTSSKHYHDCAADEEVDGFHFYRTDNGWLSSVPVLNQYDVIAGLKTRLNGLISEIRPDVLHAHSPSLNALAVASVSRSSGIPFVYEMRASWEDAAVSHGTCKEGSVRYNISQWLEKRALRSADHVVTICQGLADRAVQWGVPEEKITVIQNGVDLEAFDSETNKDEALLKELELTGKTVLGFLGSFYRYEGLHTLLDALPEMASRHPEIHLLLAGGGPEEDALRNQAKTLGIENFITFTGRIPHQQVGRYYSLVDVFIYPRESILLTEIVTPLKPLEAMAKRGLVVASDIGGHREMIENGVNGYLFKPSDSGALADTVSRLLDTPEESQQMRSNGRSYVEEQRCWSKAVKKIVPVYQQLAKA